MRRFISDKATAYYVLIIVEVRRKLFLIRKQTQKLEVINMKCTFHIINIYILMYFMYLCLAFRLIVVKKKVV